MNIFKPKEETCTYEFCNRRNLKIEIKGIGSEENEEFDDAELFLNDEAISLDEDYRIYKNMFCINEFYAALGINRVRQDNRGLTDEIIVFNVKTGEYFKVPIYKGNGASLKEISFNREYPERIYFKTSYKGGYIECNVIFDKRECVPYETFSYGSLEFATKKLETLFTYTITDDLGVIMSLNTAQYNINSKNLLLFDGFTDRYDSFKIWYNEYSNEKEPTIHMYCTNILNGKSKHLVWYNNTEYVEHEKYENCFWKLLDCIYKVYPYHPLFKLLEYYVEELD